MKTTQFFGLCAVAAFGGVGVFLYREQAKSTVVLERIVALEACLAANNQQGTQAMANTVYGIRVAVSKYQNQARDVAVLKESQQILSRAKSITDTLHRFQQALRAAVHEAPAGALHHPGASSQPGSITPQQLARQLDRYTAFIRPFIPGAPALTQDGFDETPWLYADHAPVAAALARLTRLETLVRRQATDALNNQAQKVGYPCGFDKIGAIAVASSNIVAPGATYEAQLFLTQSATSLRPIMIAEGKDLDVQPDGRGEVKFRVPPLRPGQPDTVRAQWQGIIQVKMGLGDTTFHVTVPYFIVKHPAQ
jgi:hypothetical protein